MRKASYIVLDTETTGLRAGRHGLTELYAARVDGNGVLQKDFHSMIDPGHHIPSFITRLTGIDDEMVEDAPLAGEVVESFSKFVRQKDIIVGHNLRFDLSFLNYERKRLLDSPFPNDGLCTLLLARRVLSPDPLPSYRLVNLAGHFDISAEGAHRAQKDVEMTIGVKQALFARLEEARISKTKDVLGLQRLPIAKAARLLDGQ